MEADLIGVELLIEFLEVAVHTILYVRKIYPSSIFALRKKYNIPIHISENPEINIYITESLKAAKKLLESNGVKCFSVVIHCGNEKKIIEQYSFELANKLSYDPLFVKCEELFRSAILKLSVIEHKLSELPENVSFSIKITTDEKCCVDLSDDVNFEHFPWILTEKYKGDDKIIHSVQNVQCDRYGVEIYVEDFNHLVVF